MAAFAFECAVARQHVRAGLHLAAWLRMYFLRVFVAAHGVLYPHTWRLSILPAIAHARTHGVAGVSIA